MKRRQISRSSTASTKTVWLGSSCGEVMVGLGPTVGLESIEALGSIVALGSTVGLVVGCDFCRGCLLGRVGVGTLCGVGVVWDKASDMEAVGVVVEELVEESEELELSSGGSLPPGA